MTLEKETHRRETIQSKGRSCYKSKALRPLTLKGLSRIRGVIGILQLLLEADTLVTETGRSLVDTGPGPGPDPDTTGVLHGTTPTTDVPVIEKGHHLEKDHIVGGITAAPEAGAEVGAGALGNVVIPLLPLRG